ncbi:hypothetical protein PVAND_015146 [Polypedilum vanderplanki]|uniref:C2 domain-containing protein n=1 Tax=Polypedilum vanderplanki TaxID=319348 RepID=A0A9J6BBS1_POLVA|nr:hypothetical protein PVAND_015146 [Polypedilum vanderplanki]
MTRVEKRLERSVIRRSWGKIIKPLFIMTIDNLTNDFLINEANVFDDLIVINESDEEELKLFVAFQIFKNYFRESKYFMKTNDDVLVNPKNLYDFLNDEITPENAIIGSVKKCSDKGKISEIFLNFFNINYGVEYFDYEDTFFMPGFMMKNISIKESFIHPQNFRMLNYKIFDSKGKFSKPPFYLHECFIRSNAITKNLKPDDIIKYWYRLKNLTSETCNFSESYCLFPFFLSSIKEHFSQMRYFQRAVTQATMRMDERDIILSRLDEIPTWVLFPDYERVQWLNKIIKHFWPTVNYFVVNLVKDIEPILHQQNMLRTFKFQKIDLGQITPKITGIKVHDRNQLGVNDLVIDLNFCYFGDCEMTFSLNGIEGGIKDIEVEGDMRIFIKLLPFQSPFVSNVQVFFLKHPKVNFELTAALASVNMFATGELMRSIIKEQISTLMVYPNKIQIKLDQNAPQNSFDMPAIDGVVQIEILSCENFDDAKIFVSVELGHEIENSDVAVVKNRFGNIDMNCFLIAYEHGVEEIQITINEKDENLRISSIGKTFVKLDDLKCKKVFNDNLKVEPKGFLLSDIKWLPVTFNKKAYDKNANQTLLQIFIESGRNINSKYEPFVEITISSISDRKQTHSVSVKNESAIWEKYFNFFIKDPQLDLLTVKIVDKKSQESIGFLNYQILDLFKRKTMEHELQAFPLTSSNDSEIIMAMKLNFLKCE